MKLVPCLIAWKENMLRDGLISNNKGFRDIYDEKIIPQMSDEFEYMMRWFHTAQESSVHLYDSEGNYLRNQPMLNLTTRTAYFSEADHEGEIIRGCYRQPTGGFFDHTVDPELADRGFASRQRAFDIPMADLAKGRLFGFAPYKDYREVCAKKKYTKWKDYCDTMTMERIYRLKIIYKDMEDVELMSGVWSEKRVEGCDVPPTLYCLMAEQLIRSIKSDRFWYERKHRPHAFTYNQLLQIRNANIANLLCLVADKVDKIQQKPFLKCGSKNQLMSCDELKMVDLTPWKEC